MTKKLFVTGMLVAVAMVASMTANAQDIWNFDSGSEGWSATPAFVAAYSNGKANLTYQTADPFDPFYSSPGGIALDLSASGTPYIILSFTAAGMPEGNVLSRIHLFSTDGGVWRTEFPCANGDNLVVIDIVNSTYLTLGGSGLPSDAGKIISSFRFDIPDDAGITGFESASLSIDWIAVTADQNDYDSDGLSNDDEAALLTNPLDPDSDGDGISDGDEVNTYGTNPTLPDTDGDGASDSQELFVFLTDPTTPGSFPVPAAGVAALLLLAAGLGGVAVRRMRKH